MSYRNQEGYRDPTAGAALANIMREERRRKRRRRNRPPERMGKRNHGMGCGGPPAIPEKALGQKRTITNTVNGK